MLARAGEDAEAAIASARREVEETVAAACARGEADGGARAVRELAREHALARIEVLAARRALYDELRRRARGSVLSLRDEPGYAELLDRLEAVARRELGDGAEIEVDPSEAGGVRGWAGSRRVDYTLPALAERCIAGMGHSLSRLWS